MGCSHTRAIILLTVLLALLLRASPETGNAAAGDLDPTFGSGGRVVTPLGEGEASSLVLQPDGGLLVAGKAISARDRTTDFALLRYLPDGRLDPAFGSGGKVFTDFLVTHEAANAMALQPDGRIVLAGYMNSGQTGWDVDFALARYERDGRLDSTFGSGGRIATGFGGDDRATAVAVQADGKILAAGFTVTRASSAVTATRQHTVALARYLANGLPDLDFGTLGPTMTGPQGAATALASAPDGSLVIAGGACYYTLCDPGYLMVARFSPSGSPDAAFGGTGVVTTTIIGGYDSARALALQPDGKILLAGVAGEIFHNLAAVVLRYNPNGSLDPGFGDGGRVMLDLGPGGDTADAVALQPDGKVLVAGVSNSSLILVRLAADGTLDRTFGNDGISRPGFVSTYDHAVSGLVIQPDGRIVMAGTAGASFVLARFESAPPSLPLRTWLPVTPKR